jgi:hypothetical protein
MKYDAAYCSLIKDKLTIYEVRDLNFDETDDYDSDNSIFLCPDDECREELGEKAKLSVVNAKRRKYIKTPHFKDTPSTLHREKCPYGNLTQSINTDDPASTHTEGLTEHHFPTEFIPRRRKYYKRVQKKTIGENEGLDIGVSKSRPSKNQSRGKSTNRTSVLEHIVECYVSNIDNKDILTKMPLTIEGLKLSYWSFFKKIKYFQDRQGLIYWGKVRAIKDYDFSFRVDFADRVNEKSVCLYIRKNVLDSYRKKGVFLEEIREAIQDNSEKYCFFYGIYPENKKVKNSESQFEVYNAEVVNIDHILIRSIHP